MWAKFKLYYETLRYLRWQQIIYRGWYFLRARWRGRTNFRYNLHPSFPPANRLQLKPSITSHPSYLAPRQFTFLNLSKTFDDQIDWNFKDYGKLWTYNLNYFEFLQQEALNPEEGLALILDFIQQSDSIKDGFEPFPTSLRILFWIRFLSQHQISEPQIDQSLYAQLNILQDHLEYHLLGNHLLENGFALLFGAYYFNQKSLFKKATAILESQLAEQVLPDGGHFELSPMYHQLMLYRVLDILNLVTHNPKVHPAQSLKRLLRHKAEQMVNWLTQMSFRSGAIPLLNDSAQGIAPSTFDLQNYAKHLNVPQTNITTLKESGYRTINHNKYECRIDIGPIGPDYIPGHAHSDSLNFVLYLGDLPFIVDTGTSTYEKNEQRTKERQTESHNTVQIGDVEQSEVWGGFRVGRRARVKIHKESSNQLIASHNGYRHLGITHQRSYQFKPDQITIIDQVTGQNGHSAKAFLHFHPDVEIQLEGTKIASPHAQITIDHADSIERSEYQYAPQFNKTAKSTKIIINFTAQIKITIDL